MTESPARPDGAPPRPPTAPRGIAAPWLAVIAAPLSFGIAGPALILDRIARDLGTPTATVAWAVVAFGWGIAVGTPLAAGLLRHRGVRTTVTVSASTVALGAAAILAVPGPATVVAGSALQALGCAGLVSTAMSLADTPRRTGA